MDTIPLKEFITQVPICFHSATLAVAIDKFSQVNCDKLVVVNQQLQAIGTIHLSHLIPYLLAPDRAQHPHSSSTTSVLDLQQPLSELSIPLIEPIVTIPASLTLRQFRSYLHYLSRNPLGKNPPDAYALIQNDGTYLGLLESSSLLKYLVRKDSPLVFANIEQLAVSPQLYSKPSPEHNSPISPALVELLDRLPIPFMVQSHTGQILSQNRAWRYSVRAFPHPDETKSEAASFLASVPAIAEWSAITNQPPIGSAMATPLATASEQWEFVKMPLPNFPPSLVPLDSGQSHLEIESLSELSFTSLQAAGAELTQLAVSSALGVEMLPAPVGLAPMWLILATPKLSSASQAEELTVKNAELERLNQLKDEFLTSIGHELKTPLTALLGLSSLLKSDTQTGLNERQAHYVKLIHQSARQMMAIVNDFVDLSRIEMGQMDLILESVEIATLCDRACKQVRQTVERQSPDSQLPEIRFRIEIQPGLDKLVADELRLFQMLVHLLTVAFKLTKAPGEIGLRVSQWNVEWLGFTLWNTGVGIRTSQQSFILEKFQQLERSVNPYPETTGLELVLSQRLARLHGGDLCFTSTTAQANELTLLLPRSENLQPPQQSQHTSSDSTFVLIVETDAKRIENLAGEVAKLGYKSLITQSGPEALSKARSLQPKAILLSLTSMPNEAGLTLLRQLKADPLTRQIPIAIADSAPARQLNSILTEDYLGWPVQTALLERKLNGFNAPPLPKPTFAKLSLTILYLSPSDKLEGEHRLGTTTPHHTTKKANLDRLIAGGLNAVPGCEHRIVEVDDLEQAELLSRIWKPDILLFNDAGLTDALTCLEQLSQHPSLAALPIVTLTQETTQAANQIPGLAVFPCLVAPDPMPSVSTLLEVIQVAANFARPEGRK